MGGILQVGRKPAVEFPLAWLLKLTIIIDKIRCKSRRTVYSKKPRGRKFQKKATRYSVAGDPSLTSYPLRFGHL